MTLHHFSVLDLSPVAEGETPAEALANSLRLAQAAEALGYHRFWLAEHHNMPGIASAATALVIGHVAGGTKTIRVGAGGIMLPNHAPLQVAEAFGTLETLYPGRIDLGIGRAPGTDMATARALRRHLDAADHFPADVAELLGYLGPADPTALVRAVPGEGTGVPVWILGSSLYGAQLAAHFGLPYAFASHFAPQALAEAAATYRATFRPSADLAQPRFMLAMGLCAAATDAEAEYLRSSQIAAFASLRLGRPGKLPPPARDLSGIPPAMLDQIDAALACAAVGSPATIERRIGEILTQYHPDEIIVAGMIHDPAARLESLAIGAEAFRKFTA